jgi:hypothetical protein
VTTANDEVSTLIANAETKANDALDNAVAYTDTAQLIAQGFSSLGPNQVITAQSFAVPPFTPNINLGNDFKSDFDTEWAGFETWVRGLMTDYVDTYFPTLDGDILTAENTWLINVVNNGYVGIPTAVETAMWDRARAKDTIEALRMEDEALNHFSARGFALPPGVLANRLQMIQQEAANKASTIARDLAIKQTELSIEMTKFAIEEMVKLRIGIATALAEFMRAWMSLPQMAIDFAKTKAELNKVLWDSSANYIHALVAKANLQLDADKTNLQEKVHSDQIFVTNYLGAQKLRVDAATMAAEEMGRVAAAYANSMNTLGHIGDITTTAA